MACRFSWYDADVLTRIPLHSPCPATPSDMCDNETYSVPSPYCDDVTTYMAGMPMPAARSMLLKKKLKHPMTISTYPTMVACFSFKGFAGNVVDGECSMPASRILHTRFNAVFTVRRYALHGLSYRNSVRASVCLSVCLSVTLVHCVHMVQPTIMISSPYGRHIILVSGDIRSSQNSKGITKSEGVEWGWGGD